MTKKNNFIEKILEFWPILAVFVSGICAYSVLYYRVDQLERRQDRQGEWCQRLSVETGSLRERCAKLER